MAAAGVPPAASGIAREMEAAAAEAVPILLGLVGRCCSRRRQRWQKGRIANLQLACRGLGGRRRQRQCDRRRFSDRCRGRGRLRERGSILFPASEMMMHVCQVKGAGTVHLVVLGTRDRCEVAGRGYRRCTTIGFFKIKSAPNSNLPSSINPLQKFWIM